ncbi:MAG: hypothetical protein M3345_06795 [Actinomycetota bacterium]|nr:hypothetical protein [Actinomycetota bacterium]
MERRLSIALALCLVVAGVGAAHAERPRRAPLKGTGEGLKLIANVPYEGGTDMEFATIKGHDYAFVGAAPGVGGAASGALRVINIDNPAKPKVVATLNCALYQADIQISHDKKTLIMGADSTGGPEACLMVGKTGFMTVDISNPLKPRPLGIGEIRFGSHNITAHPTKPYIYNSDSERTNANIEIWSIKNPAKPEKIKDVPSLPHSPHDISFNADGTRAVTAARTHFDIFDTRDPENPKLLFTGQCPGCYLTHDAKFTPDGKHIILGDEANGGGAYPCGVLGALYFYELQGSAEQPIAVLVGMYMPNELVSAGGGTELAACTSHVFDISNDSKRLSISWYSAGTRYLDISNMNGITFGQMGNGVKELGWFIPEGGVSWSSKMFKGPYIYSNDEFRGFDVFKIDAKK